MANYTKTNVGSTPRTELHDNLGLTGAEVSINQLPAGAGVPFVHAHQQNEEIYGILAGKGKAVIDGEEIALTAGDWLKVAPAAKRQFSAAADSSITYVCIQDLRRTTRLCTNTISKFTCAICSRFGAFSFENSIIPKNERTLPGMAEPFWY